MNPDVEQEMNDAATNLCESAANLGFSSFSQQAIAEARRHVQQHGMGSLQTYMVKKLNEWKNVKVKMAITGQSGAGKLSTGLRDCSSITQTCFPILCQTR